MKRKRAGLTSQTTFDLDTWKAMLDCPVYFALMWFIAYTGKTRPDSGQQRSALPPRPIQHMAVAIRFLDLLEQIVAEVR